MCADVTCSDLLFDAYKTALQRMDEQGMSLVSAAELAFSEDGIEIYVKIIRFDSKLLAQDPYSGGLLGSL